MRIDHGSWTIVLGGDMGESTAPGIRVEPAELERLARTLWNELESNLRIQADDIKHEFLQGPGFGDGTASEPLRASHDEYARCLTTARGALDYYVDATDALVTALRLAADLYRDADANARTQYTGFEAAGASYTSTLAALQTQREVSDIRDAHVHVRNTDR